MFLIFKLHTSPRFFLSHVLFSAIRLNHSFGSTLFSEIDQCRTVEDLKIIHTQVILHGFAKETLIIGKLISFCATTNFGDLSYAEGLFNLVQKPNKFMFNNLIRLYSSSDEPERAIFLYRRMISLGFSPNQFTFSFVIKACSYREIYSEIAAIHCHGIKFGSGFHVCVQNALINRYFSFNLIEHAQDLFDDMPERNMVSWNSIIGGYSKSRYMEEACVLFCRMLSLGINPDKFTLVNMFSGFSETCNFEQGRQLHCYIEVLGIEIDVYVQNTLIDMYAKCGYLHLARHVFDRSYKNVVSWTSIFTAYANTGLIEHARQMFDLMPVKNVISWNSMISYLVRKCRYNDALILFSKMFRLETALLPDKDTIGSVLSACSQMGHLITGRSIHCYVIRRNMTTTIYMNNSLMDMYSKCGIVDIAVKIFSRMYLKNSVSWNVIIGSFALHGYGLVAIKLFHKMIACGFYPDAITYTGLLSACSHSGLVDVGKYYFDLMIKSYGIYPELEHYACMVDLLGRWGLLSEALLVVRGMSMKPDSVVLGALVAACRIHGNAEIRKQILKQLLELEMTSGGLYVVLSNMFSELGRWEDVRNIRILMKNMGVKKCCGASTIEIDGCIHEFMVNEKAHESCAGTCRVICYLKDHSTSYDFSDFDIPEEL